MGKREQHIHALADALNIAVMLCTDGIRDDSYASKFHICVYEWNGSKKAYFTALHELGHITNNHTKAFKTRYLRRQLEAEAEAWEFALRESREQVGRVIRNYIAHCLNTYLDSITSRPARREGPSFTRVAEFVGLRR